MPTSVCSAVRWVGVVIPSPPTFFTSAYAVAYSTLLIAGGGGRGGRRRRARRAGGAAAQRRQEKREERHDLVTPESACRPPPAGDVRGAARVKVARAPPPARKNKDKDHMANPAVITERDR